MTTTPNTDTVDLGDLVTGLFKLAGIDLTDSESPEKEETAAEGTPEAPAGEVDELSIEGLSLETIRILKKAETTDYVDEADSLLRVADRYIRLVELAILADSTL